MKTNSKEPLNRFVEKESEMEKLSPLNPSDVFAPPTVDPVAYKDMAPILQKFINEHKVCINVVNDFESALNNWKRSGWTFIEDINNDFKNLFSFLDNNAAVHNKNEEKALFPLLHKRLIETGEHGSVEDPKTVVDILEDDHIKIAQLGSLCMNFLDLGSSLHDKRSREITFEHAFQQGVAIVETLKLHIFREDETLFPLAMKLITKEEFEDMELGIK